MRARCVRAGSARGPAGRRRVQSAVLCGGGWGFVTLADAMDAPAGHENERAPDLLFPPTLPARPGHPKLRRGGPKVHSPKTRPGHKSSAFLRGVQCTCRFFPGDSASASKAGFWAVFGPSARSEGPPGPLPGAARLGPPLMKCSAVSGAQCSPWSFFRAPPARGHRRAGGRPPRAFGSETSPGRISGASWPPRTFRRAPGADPPCARGLWTVRLGLEGGEMSCSHCHRFETSLLFTTVLSSVCSVFE